MARSSHVFFKVFNKATSSDRLKLPSKLTLDKLQTPKVMVSLRDKYSNHWPVTLVNIKNVWYFRNGWAKFVKDNSVDSGEFMFFQFDGDKVFDVIITGHDSCDKEGVGGPMSKETTEEHKGEETVDEEMEEQGNQPLEELSVEEILGDDEDEETEVDEEDEEMEEQENQPLEELSVEEILGDDEDEETEVDEEDEEMEEQENQPLEELSVEEILGDDEDEEMEEEDDKKRAENLSVRKELKRGVTEWRKEVQDPVTRKGKSNSNRTKKFHNRAGAKRTRAKAPDPYGTDIFTSGILPLPQNPYFVTKIRPKRLKELYIPANVFSDYSITNLPKTATVRDLSGRTWHAKLSCWADGRKVYRGGWGIFCRFNSVREEKLCVCELLREGDKQDLVIQIQVVPTGENA